LETRNSIYEFFLNPDVEHVCQNGEARGLKALPILTPDPSFSCRVASTHRQTVVAILNFVNPQRDLYIAFSKPEELDLTISSWI
jgi:hypothetical protein